MQMNEALWQLDFHSMQGRKSENQDSLLITTCLPYDKLAASAPLLVLMADGVSACQFPKQASQLVVNTVAHHLTLALKNKALQEMVLAENQAQ